MNTLLRRAAALAAICISFNGLSQPVIDGPAILCPESFGTYTTGAYDSYQWYKHDYISGDTILLTGETSQSITIDAYNYTPCWLIVEVTNGPLTMMSEEFFIDGWAFLPPVVATYGNSWTNEWAVHQACIGDTLIYEFMQPYEVNITWYYNGNPIPGQTDDSLIVTESGYYNVEGAPELCPDWIQQLGVTLSIEFVDCDSTAGFDENDLPLATIFPNPATDQLTIEHSSEPITGITLHDASGRIVQTHEVNQLSATIDVSALEKGTYFVTIAYGERHETQPVSIQ
jgi:hypothetical protein